MHLFVVMPVLDTGIHAFPLSGFDSISTWMAGSGPGHDDPWVNLRIGDSKKDRLPD
tara:strand:- start:85367 stop:85534 length:168 start_codon:yes stop_codon:yes gene_type:complete